MTLVSLICSMGGLNQITFRWRFRFVDGVLVDLSFENSKQTS